MKKKHRIIGYLWLLPVILMARDQGNGQTGTVHVPAPPAAEEVVNGTQHPLLDAPEAALDGEQGFDAKQRALDAVELVNRGAEFFDNNTLDVSCNAFTRDKQFRYGELYLFVYDYNGTCLAHGQEESLVWANMYNTKDTYGTLFVQEMIQVAKKGGGWVAYEWRKASKRSYAKEVVKGGKSFIIASGFYPHSKIDAVVNLVRGAVQHFKDVVIKLGDPVSEAFSTISYPLGRFVRGDLYLYALDFEGITMAHGERPGLIGTSGWGYKDVNGVYVNQSIIAKLKETSGGVWQEYVSKNAPKVAYAEKVEDQTGKQYFIACGYYPDANRKEVVDLVRKGYEFFKKHGRGVAAQNFSDRRNNRFRYGDLSLTIHDYKGKIIADGDNQDLVGLSAMDFQDQDGTYVVREFIEKAKAGGGWVSFKLKNSYKSSYVEPIKIGVEEYVISSGLYPISKKETMELIVKGAVSLLKVNEVEKALHQLVKVGSPFISGDLGVFVLNATGIVLAWSDDHELLWRNLLNAKDDEGRPYIRNIINSVKRGPARITYTMNGKKRVVYAEQVEKDGATYIVGSAYYI